MSSDLPKVAQQMTCLRTEPSFSDLLSQLCSTYHKGDWRDQRQPRRKSWLEHCWCTHGLPWRTRCLGRRRPGPCGTLLKSKYWYFKSLMKPTRL